MKIKKIVLILLVMQSIVKLSKAQQDPLYGQYVFNNAIINPAQAGVKENNQLGLLYRNQWAGIDGAPINKSLFLNMRLPKNLGLALGIYSDEIGPIRELTIQTDLAYHVRLSDDWNFSGGVRLMTSNITSYVTTLKLVNQYDPIFAQDITSGNYFNAGGGILIYNNNIFFGAAIPKIITKNFGNGNTVLSETKKHIFIYGGMNIEMGSDYTFMPSLLYKQTADAPVQLDLNAVFDYRNTFQFGPMLRSLDAVGFLLGMKLNKNWQMGYMYEYPLTDLNRVTSLSNEITLSYIWKTSYRKSIRSPRYFF